MSAPWEMQLKYFTLKKEGVRHLPLSRITKYMIFRNRPLLAHPHGSLSLSRCCPSWLPQYPCHVIPPPPPLTCSLYDTLTRPKSQNPDAKFIRITRLSWNPSGFISFRAVFFVFLFPKTVTHSHSAPHRTAKGSASSSASPACVHTKREMWTWRRTLGRARAGEGARRAGRGLKQP